MGSPQRYLEANSYTKSFHYFLKGNICTKQSIKILKSEETYKKKINREKQ